MVDSYARNTINNHRSKLSPLERTLIFDDMLAWLALSLEGHKLLEETVIK